MREAVLRHAWTRLDSQHLLNDLIERGGEGEFSDYGSGEQVVMAIDALLIELGSAARHREKLDALSRILRDDDAYQPGQLRAALGELGRELRSES